MKKRGSKHERTIREFRLDRGHIEVGETLRAFRGILTGCRSTTRSSTPLWTKYVNSNTERRDGYLPGGDRGGASTRALLAPAGIQLEICATFDVLVSQLQAGAAAVLVPEEAVSFEHTKALHDLLATQPPWSDLPVLVLTRPGADSAEVGEAIRSLGNVTLLERPLRISTLLSAVQTALRARNRQYQIRGHLEDRAHHEESLRIADQRKDEFLATLGHELRNPLAPLMTGLQLLKMAALRDLDAAQVTLMERQVRHLVRLVDDLLELSRITRGVIDVQRVVNAALGGQCVSP
jgi:signal transduction histidine kinase